MLFDAKDIGEPGFITRARTLTILLLYRCLDRTAMIRPEIGGAPAASSWYLCTTVSRAPAAVSCSPAAVTRSHASCVLSLPRYSWLTRYFLSLARRTLSLACRFVSVARTLLPRFTPVTLPLRQLPMLPVRTLAQALRPIAVSSNLLYYMSRIYLMLTIFPHDLRASGCPENPRNAWSSGPPDLLLDKRPNANDPWQGRIRK